MNFAKSDYKKNVKIIILMLLLAEIIMTASLVYKNWQRSEVLCVIGESCTSVQSSIYGEILGITVSYIAIIAFAGLLVIYFASNKWFIFGAVLGAGVSLYFIILQLFVLKEICTSCMFIDGIMIIILV